MVENWIRQFRLVEAFKNQELLSSSLICQSESDKSLFSSFLLRYWGDQKSQFYDGDNNKSSLDDWLILFLFKDEINQLTEEEKSNWLDLLSNSVANKARKTLSLNEVFISKLYYFAKNSFKPLFGKPMVAMTDVTLVRQGPAVSQVVLGSGPVNFQTDDLVFGFYFVNLGGVKFENQETGSYIEFDLGWIHDEEEFTAKVSGKVLKSAGEFIPKLGSFDYQAFKKDGDLSGLVLAGSNLGKLSSKMISYYKNYFKESGFQFEKPMTVLDTLNFLKERLISAQVDYFIKQSHSGGDDKGLVVFNEQSIIHLGRRKRLDGVEEVIYLVDPIADSVSVRLENQSFGEWVRQREQETGIPLAYVNTSCSSYTRALNQISAVNSEYLVTIPSVSSVWTFVNKPTNTTRLLIDGIRAELTFAEIRSKLQESPEFSKGNDHFIFPDEEIYKNNIRNNLEIPIDFKVKMFNSLGKEVHFEDWIH